jgi:high-affinity nickel permease
MRQWRGVRGSRRANTGSINGETAPLLGPKNDAGMHAHYGEAEHTHLVTITENAEVESVGGLFAKCCPVVMRAVDAPWKMYPIGFLFGLGFDTATEVALLAICAMGPKEKIPG